MRVGIVGAGVAGLTTAKVLKQAGHEVIVYDKAPDVGGVSFEPGATGVTTTSGWGAGVGFSLPVAPRCQ